MATHEIYGWVLASLQNSLLLIEWVQSTNAHTLCTVIFMHVMYNQSWKDPDISRSVCRSVWGVSWNLWNLYVTPISCILSTEDLPSELLLYVRWGIYQVHTLWYKWMIYVNCMYRCSMQQHRYSYMCTLNNLFWIILYTCDCACWKQIITQIVCCFGTVFSMLFIVFSLICSCFLKCECKLISFALTTYFFMVHNTYLASSSTQLSRVLCWLAA